MARYSVKRSPILDRKTIGIKPRLRPNGRPKSKDKLDQFMTSQLSRIKAGLTRMSNRIHKEQLRSAALSVDIVGSVGYEGPKRKNLSKLEGEREP